MTRPPLAALILRLACPHLEVAVLMRPQYDPSSQTKRSARSRPIKSCTFCDNFVLVRRIWKEYVAAVLSASFRIELIRTVVAFNWERCDSQVFPDLPNFGAASTSTQVLVPVTLFLSRPSPVLDDQDSD
jgi:hypothetical protein